MTCLLPIGYHARKSEYKGHFMERDGTYFNGGDQRLNQINDEYAFQIQNKQRVYQGDGLRNHVDPALLNGRDLSGFLFTFQN